MKVYKYRSGNSYLERNLDSIEKNYFFAPNAKLLNDPCETFVLSDRIKYQSNIFSKMLGNKSKETLKNLHNVIDNIIADNQRLGIYSLSKTYNDELLWAHYANNHKGFCIEYALDILINDNKFNKFYSFPVSYASKPPQIEMTDVSSKDFIGLLKKLAGTKSKRWSYEKEIRIITDKFGEQDYDFKAVKSIYFGFRMPEDEIDKIMKRLKGRGIQYFQIQIYNDSYLLSSKSIKDKYERAKKYLFEFYRKPEQGITLPLIVDYNIEKLKYHTPFKKGELSIKLDNKLSKSELSNLGEELNNKLFRNAERTFIFYYLNNILTDNGAWAITHFEPDSKTIEILGLSIEEEREFISVIQNESRNVIGHWIDNSAYTSSLITLFKAQDKTYLELLYSDNSKSTKEQRITNVSNGIRYEDKKQNEHGEYFIINNKNIMEFYSPDGVYKQLKNYLQHAIY